MRNTNIFCRLVLLMVLIGLSSTVMRGKDSSTVTFNGRVVRSDMIQPVADALVSLIDEEKKSAEDKPVEMRTNKNGEFTFEVAPGKYTIQVKIWYKRPEQIPCHDQLAGVTLDKGSSVIVMPDRDGTLQRVILSGFKIKAGKPVSREIDIVCKRPEF
jgi:hypothetical protein